MTKKTKKPKKAKQEKYYFPHEEEQYHGAYRIDPEITLKLQKADTHPNRKKIALDTLARYSGTDAKYFQEYILLTNFPHYVDAFADEQ